MEKLLAKLRKDFPEVVFEESSTFCWSPKTHKVLYPASANKNPKATWSLLHEVAHAVLGHMSYESDFELLSFEVAAWHKAEELAKKYGIAIDSDHIQDCLDTYRDWLHQRSTCPTCGNKSLQKDAEHYQCFNCLTDWKVTTSRFCRPYRRLKTSHKEKSQPVRDLTATFH